MVIKMVEMVFSSWVSVSPEFITLTNSSTSLHRADWSVLGLKEEKQIFLLFLHFFLTSGLTFEAWLCNRSALQSPRVVPFDLCSPA